MVVISILLFIIFIILLYYNSNGKVNRKDQQISVRLSSPPGPINLPVIGGIYLLDRNNLHLSFDQLYKRYGKIFSIRFGSIETVVLNEPDIIFEALHKNSISFNDRFMLESVRILSGNGSNIAFSNGEYWKRLRSEFTSLITKSKNKNLEYQFNRHYFKFESFLLNYIKYDSKIYLKPFIMTYTFNVIFSLIFNESIEYQQDLVSKDFQEFIQCLFDVLKEATLCPDYLPFLKCIKNYERLKAMTNKMLDFLRPKIQKIIKEMDESRPQSILEHLIVKIKNEQVLNIDHLDHIILDLLLAGMETSGGVIEWMVLNLTNNQDVQDLLYEELSSNSTSDKPYPSINDTSNYPYFMACLKETMRRSPIAAIGPPRVCNQDTTIGGYLISKDTQVFSNLYSYSFSEKFHHDPYSFNPSRFIQSPNAPILIFNLGPRQCPAKGMAEYEVFSFATKLFNRFKFTSPDNQHIDETPLFHVSLTPKKWIVNVSER